MDLFDEYASAANDSNTDLELHLGELEESEEKPRMSHGVLIPSTRRFRNPKTQKIKNQEIQKSRNPEIQKS
eukprot:13935231-Heterocapsa_arctica.AAC.1